MRKCFTSQAGWILIGCHYFIVHKIVWKVIPTILFPCAIIIIVVVWALLFFYILKYF